ncbi:MAG: hypothetical protein AUJ18_06825 [Candidatus Hydrogenedentes bacterium CG1_02_42_14]|nr:MAG: hypothetical protein AUJ18_06825 [Candidatus Hydrogenedentes bacterium CG1_02_42_14]
MPRVFGFFLSLGLLFIIIGEPLGCMPSALAAQSTNGRHNFETDLDSNKMPHWYHECEINPIPVSNHDTSVLALRKTDVAIHVIGPFAEIEVIQYYNNPADFPITVGYTFPLPENAAIRELEMVTDSRILRADIKELEEARKIYSAAEEAGNGAVLVEQIRDNIFRSSIANIGPGKDLAVRIRYSQRVPIQTGQYRLLFPTVVAPRYCPASEPEKNLFDLPYVPSSLPGHSISINVSIDAGVPISNISSATHEITVSANSDGSSKIELNNRSEVPNRDFVLTWKIPVDQTRTMIWRGEETENEIPFMFIAYPKLQTRAENKPREIIFILDSSGSMSGSKFDAAKKALKGLLRGLSPNDKFRLIEFDDSFTELSNSALPFNQHSLDKADAWIDSLQADGGTEILKPIKHVFSGRLSREKERGRNRFVILLTDGQVSNEDEVLREVSRNIGNDRVFSMGIDYAVNDAMLKSMARVGKGACLLLTPEEDIEGAVLSLSNRFGDPVLSKIVLSFDSTRTELFPNPIPDLFDDEPLVVLGRIKGAVPNRVQVNATSGNSVWSEEHELVFEKNENINIGAIVAEKEIENLSDKMRDGDADAIKNKIIEISLRSRIASRYTAFVVVETREERTDTGLVRKVEVPVAFPYGWNWSTVFGSDENDVDACKSVNANFHAMGSGVFSMAECSPASPGYTPMQRRSGLSSNVQNVSPHVLSLRFLARTQRASGLWLSSGVEDIKTSALAVIGLMSNYSLYRGNIDRALSALRNSDLAHSGEDVRALVKAALMSAYQTTGDANLKTEAGSIQTLSHSTLSELSKLSTSSNAVELTKFAGIVLLESPSASERAQVANMLEGLISGSGVNAGQVSLSGSDSVLATALYAALGY